MPNTKTNSKRFVQDTEWDVILRMVEELMQKGKAAEPAFHQAVEDFNQNHKDPEKADINWNSAYKRYNREKNAGTHKDAYQDALKVTNEIIAHFERKGFTVPNEVLEDKARLESRKNEYDALNQKIKDARNVIEDCKKQLAQLVNPATTNPQDTPPADEFQFAEDDAESDIEEAAEELEVDLTV
jgi:ribosomal protein S20